MKSLKSNANLNDLAYYCSEEPGPLPLLEKALIRGRKISILEPRMPENYPLAFARCPREGIRICLSLVDFSAFSACSLLFFSDPQRLNVGASKYIAPHRLTSVMRDILVHGRAALHRTDVFLLLFRSLFSRAYLTLSDLDRLHGSFRTLSSRESCTTALLCARKPFIPKVRLERRCSASLNPRT